MKSDSPRQQRRRAALRVLANEVGSVRALGLQVGSPNTHLGAILAARRGMGDELAAKLEKRTGKPSGWMDDPLRDLDPRGAAPSSEHAEESHQVCPSLSPVTGTRFRTTDGGKASAGGADAQFSGMNWSQQVIPAMGRCSSTGGLLHGGWPSSSVISMTVTPSWIGLHAPASNPGDLVLTMADSDGMAPIFSAGDVLVVDSGVAEVDVDGIYVVHLNGALRINRVQRRPDGQLWIRFDNPAYEALLVDPRSDDFRVLGKVLTAWNSRAL